VESVAYGPASKNSGTQSRTRWAVWEANHVWLIFVIVMLSPVFPRLCADLRWFVRAAASDAPWHSCFAARIYLWKYVRSTNRTAIIRSAGT